MALINTTTTGVLGSTIFGDGTGPLTIQQNGVTLGTYGNIPAFKAVRVSSTQSLTSQVWAKVQFNSEMWDTNNNYDNATNYRFQPTVAGYYQLNSNIFFNASASMTFVAMEFYKNGASGTIGGGYYGYIPSQTNFAAGMTDLVYANGTTDYFEVWAYASASSPGISALTYTNFSGYLVKAV
jgi:hypothetical protein